MPCLAENWRPSCAACRTAASMRYTHDTTVFNPSSQARRIARIFDVTPPTILLRICLHHASSSTYRVTIIRVRASPPCLRANLGKLQISPGNTLHSVVKKNRSWNGTGFSRRGHMQHAFYVLLETWVQLFHRRSRYRLFYLLDVP